MARFSVVPGSCPPLFSRPGCTQVGAVIVIKCQPVGSACSGMGWGKTVDTTPCQLMSVPVAVFSCPVTFACP